MATKRTIVNQSPINDLNDVNASPTDGQVLTWNNTSGQWEAATAPGAGGGEANTASNVGTGGVGLYKTKVGVDLQFKKLNTGSAKITITDDTGNDEVDVDLGTVAINDLSNVNTTPTDGQVLTWNNGAGEWQAVTPSGGSVSLDGLTDTTITAAAKGDILVHNGTSWVDLTVGTNDQVLTADSTQATGLKWATAAGGSSTFVTLTDTPADYTGHGSKFVKVNSGATALEFVADPGYLTGITGESVGDLSDVTITAAAKGDILVHNGSAWIDIGVGTDNQVLTADSAEASGVKWATAAGGSPTYFSDNFAGVAPNLGSATVSLVIGQDCSLGSGQNIIAIGENVDMGTLSGSNNIGIGEDLSSERSGNLLIGQKFSPNGSWKTNAIMISPDGGGTLQYEASSVFICSYKPPTRIGSGTSTVIGGYHISSNFLSTKSFQCSIGSTDVKPELYGQEVKGTTASFASAGDSQLSRIHLGRQTTDATGALLSPNKGTEVITVPSNKVWGFELHCTAKQTAGSAGTVGDSKFFILQGLIKNISGTTSIVGSITSTVVAADTGASAWTCTATANDTSNTLELEVTGETNKTIRWVADLRLTEVA